MKSELTITLLQADSKACERQANLAHYTELLTGLAEGTDVLLLPEMFPTGFQMDAAYFEPHRGEAFAWMQAVAKQYDCAVGGSIAVQDGGHNYNRFYWVEPSGASVHYDKRNLFLLAGEEKVFTAGSERVVVHHRGWRLMLQTCFDLRFPETGRSRGDYDVLLYTASWPAARDFAWQSLLTARAIENQCYLAAVNRVGLDGKGFPHVGHSVVLDFLGQPMGGLPDGAEGLLRVSCSAERLGKLRASFPLFPHAEGR